MGPQQTKGCKERFKSCKDRWESSRKSLEAGLFSTERQVGRNWEEQGGGKLNQDTICEGKKKILFSIKGGKTY